MTQQKKHFFAADLGATSGRTILGTLSDGKIELEELTRFANNLIQTGGHVYWDIYALYHEIVNGLKVAAKKGVEIESIGIDTWGVDFGLLDKNGHLLGLPVHYRDARLPTATRIPWEAWRNFSQRRWRRERCMTKPAYSL